MPDSDASERKAQLEEKIRSLGVGVIPFWTRSMREQHEDPQILHRADMNPLLLEAGEVITLPEFKGIGGLAQGSLRNWNIHEWEWK